MMRQSITKGLLVAAGILTLGACTGGFTPQPRATMFEASSQQVLNSASHWDVLAAHEAARVQAVVPAASLLGRPNPSPSINASLCAVAHLAKP